MGQLIFAILLLILAIKIEAAKKISYYEEGHPSEILGDGHAFSSLPFTHLPDLSGNLHSILR